MVLIGNKKLYLQEFKFRQFIGINYSRNEYIIGITQVTPVLFDDFQKRQMISIETAY